jgi:DNA-binding PadR family transcriptional regulator
MKRGEKNMQSILKRLFPSASSSEMESAGDRVLKRLHAEVPECIEEFRFRPDIRIKAESLRPLDKLVLTAVYLLRGEGYTLSITLKVEEWTSKECHLGSVYLSVDHLEELGLISTKTTKVGEYPRRFFSITESGKRVLAQMGPAQQAIEKLGHFA